MHNTAYLHCQNFVSRFLQDAGKVLDVGSYDVNGTLKPIFEGWEYTGVDRAPGPNVDLVISREFPFEDKTFDVVVSSSTLEHDPIFWVTFKEMVRVAKDGGFIYINVPSNTRVHRHPVDCWRFFPDCWIGLEAENSRARLVDSFIDENAPHHDNVAIFAIGSDFVSRTAIPLQ